MLAKQKGGEPGFAPFPLQAKDQSSFILDLAFSIKAMSV
jgi:hypothetical protein